MALVDQYALAIIGAFQQRVQTAIAAAAITIQSEAQTTLLSVDVAAAVTTITPVAVTGFATNDLVVIGLGLTTVETRKITVASPNFTVTATTSLHKAGEVIQKVIWNHMNRANWARSVLNDPARFAEMFSLSICANDATFIPPGTQITDTQINTAVNNVWNALAGTT